MADAESLRPKGDQVYQIGLSVVEMFVKINRSGAADTWRQFITSARGRQVERMTQLSVKFLYVSQ